MVHRPAPFHPPRSEKEALDRRVFNNPDVLDAAKNLLGLSLFTWIDDCLTGGVISETEAYAGVEDKASHAYGGRRTKRTEPMFQNGGIAYIYLCYGIHSLFNVVTNKEGIPHAVLIRSLIPTHGINVMLRRRKKHAQKPGLTSGPGALAQALGITVALTGTPLDSECLWIADTKVICAEWHRTPRIGVDYAKECAILPYRFVATKFCGLHLIQIKY